MVIEALFSFHSGADGLVCLESDDECESGCGMGKEKENESAASGSGVLKDLGWISEFDESPCSFGMLRVVSVRPVVMVGCSLLFISFEFKMLIRMTQLHAICFRS